MKLNLGAMLKVVAIGLMIELLLCGVTFRLGQNIGLERTYPPSPTELQQLFLGLTAANSTGSGSLSCVRLLLYCVMGVVYGWLARRDQGSIDPAPAALGGGISAVVIGTIGAAIGTCGSLDTGGVIQPVVHPSGAITGGISMLVLVGMLAGLCVAPVISAGLGAAAGAIYAAIARRGQPRSVTPSV